MDSNFISGFIKIKEILFGVKQKIIQYLDIRNNSSANKSFSRLPYYKKFIDIFPDISTLALASQDEVLKLWQGLGYYSRAINLHSTAQYIYYECDGKFPNTFNEIINLKASDYTASAVASICYNLPEAVVDGNVYRFLSRFFGISIPINTNSAHHHFKKKAAELMDFDSPGEFNQAMMEFGALQCK